MSTLASIGLFYFFLRMTMQLARTKRKRERERESYIGERGERRSRVVCRPSCCFESWLEFLLVLVLLLLWYERTNELRGGRNSILLLHYIDGYDTRYRAFRVRLGTTFALPDFRYTRIYILLIYMDIFKTVRYVCTYKGNEFSRSI